MLRRPQRLRTTDLENEIAQNLRAIPRVVHFRMELHRKPLLRHILNSRDRMSGLGSQLKARRQLQRFVPMRHPNRLPFRQALKQHRLGDDVNLRVPVLSLVRWPHFAAESMHHELQAVADAEHGQPQSENLRIRRWRIFVVDRPRRPREHNAGGRVALQLIKRRRTGEHHGKNILFADAARDELRVLRAKVKNDDALVENGLGFHG